METSQSRCVHCETVAAPSAKFCTHCGAAFKSPSNSGQHQNQHVDPGYRTLLEADTAMQVRVPASAICDDALTSGDNKTAMLREVRDLPISAPFPIQSVEVTRCTGNQFRPIVWGTFYGDPLAADRMPPRSRLVDGVIIPVQSYPFVFWKDLRKTWGKAVESATYRHWVLSSAEDYDQKQTRNRNPLVSWLIGNKY